MATNFPTSLDALTNPTGSSSLTSPDHAGQHTDANDAIEALQAKVGVDGSAVTTSLDYKISNLNASNLVTGTVPSARISGSYTGITGVGTLSAGSIPATLLTGTVASARLSGSYGGITGLGTLSSLIVNGASADSPQLEFGDWNQDGRYSAIRSAYGYLLLGSAINVNCYLRTDNASGSVIIGGGLNNSVMTVGASSVSVSGSLSATSFSGNGASVTSLSASNLASGTVPSARVTGAYTSGITNMTIGSATTNNSTLNVIGGTAWFSAMGTGTGSTVINTFGFLAIVSSRREIKENITTVDTNTALSRICALRPVDYTLKPEFVINPSELTSIDYKRGFIAQEVAEVDHWYGQWGWVDEDQKMVTQQALAGELPLEDATPIYWNHDAMIADLVASVQVLNARLVALES
jgi:hypothetical protein